MSINNKYLKALEVVLSKRYSSTHYSLGDYQESAVCIQSEGAGWIIYVGERGNKNNVSQFDNAIDACVAFFCLITHNQDLIKEMKEEFFSLISGKSAEEIYAELAKSRACYERGEYEDFDVALDDIRTKFLL